MMRYYVLYVFVSEKYTVSTKNKNNFSSISLKNEIKSEIRARYLYTLK